MIANVEWKGGMLLDGQSQSGHRIVFDASAEHKGGTSPMEAVLTALCACTAVDVVSILEKKRQPVTGLTVRAEAEQAPEPPRTFTHIKLVYRISGNVSREAVSRAVDLSKNKYCSVSKMLEKAAKIEFTIEYADGGSTA